MNICVYCSSSDQVKDKYKQEASILGKWIADKGHTLVYGGATGGLMTSVAQGTADANGYITGIIPEVIVEKGRKSTLPTELLEVEDMGQRKAMMKEYSDIFVVLPGGFGTIDELFDALSSCMVGEHDKTTILYNPDNYWEGLLLQIKRIVSEGTGYKIANAGLKVAETLDEVFHIIEENN